MDATSFKENSWDNREFIHVCQADLNRSHFPLAQESRSRAEKHMGGRKSCGQRQTVLALAPPASLLVPIIAPVGRGHHVTVGTRQHSDPSRCPALVRSSSLLNVPLKPRWSSTPASVYLGAKCGLLRFWEWHGKVLNVLKILESPAVCVLVLYLALN